MLNSFTAYSNNGFNMAIGFFPETGVNNAGYINAPGREVRSGFGRQWDFNANRTMGQRPGAMRPLGPTPSHSPGMISSGIGLGVSTLMVGMGAYDNGWKGAFDAAMIEVAANAAIHKHAYIRSTPGIHLGLHARDTMGGLRGASGGVSQAAAGSTTITQRSWWGGQSNTSGRVVGHLGIGLGAYFGASIGSESMGTVGAFAGAAIGARIMRSPLQALLGVAAIGGATMVGKGAYQILKTGYRKAQTMKGFDLAGDTTSFLTRNAVTMRSRAMEAMHRSHLNARSALGHEASYMHMNRDHFSAYRRVGNMM